MDIIEGLKLFSIMVISLILSVAIVGLIYLLIDYLKQVYYNKCKENKYMKWLHELGYNGPYAISRFQKDNELMPDNRLGPKN